MSTKVVLVTGGTGYVGSHTVVSLLEAGYEVVIVDNLSNSSHDVVARIESISQRAVTFYQLDLCDAAALQTVFDQHQFHAVLHFAGLKSVAESVQVPMEYYRNNVVGSIQLLSCIEQHAVPYLIFSSSATVYGAQAIPPYSEELPFGEPTSPYGATKQAVERLIHAQCARTSTATTLAAVSLRYFNPIGAHPSGLLGELAAEQPNNLLPIMLNVATGHQPELAVYGDQYATPDGTCRRDYVHVMDVAAGHVKALSYLECPTIHKTENVRAIDPYCHQQDQHLHRSQYHIFNLGTGSPRSVLELVRHAEQIINISIPFTIKAARTGDLAEFWADTHKAQAQLNWHPQYDIVEMITDAWRWHAVQYPPNTD